MKLSRAQQASQTLNYRQMVLAALQNVKALVSYRTVQDRVMPMDETISAAKQF